MSGVAWVLRCWQRIAHAFMRRTLTIALARQSIQSLKLAVCRTDFWLVNVYVPNAGAACKRLEYRLNVRPPSRLTASGVHFLSCWQH